MSSKSFFKPPQVPGYTYKKYLGHGMKGALYQVQRDDDYAENPDKFALRIVNIGKKKNIDDEISLLSQQCDNLKRISCETLITCYEYGSPGSFFFALYNSPEKGSLKYLLFKNRKQRVAIAERFVLGICADLAKALVEVHLFKLPHGDVTPQNIFMNNEGRFVLGEYGISKHFTLSDTNVISAGMPYYLPPEVVVNDSETTLRSDIFSLGCVLWECCNLQPLFPDYFSVIKYNNDKQLPNTFFEGYSEVLREVIQTCLNYESKKRPEAEDILDVDCIKKYIQDRINPHPTKLTYPESHFVFVVNEEVKSDSTKPQVDVSTVDRYSIEPSLPNGLIFDEQTGAISGKPTQSQKSQRYIVTVEKGDEGCDTSINIAIITSDPPANLKYPKDKWILKIDSEVTITPTCDNIPTAYMSPSGLPNGLFLDPNTGVVTGSPTDASPPAGYTIVAKNKFGSSVFQVEIEIIDVFNPRDPSY